MWLRLRFLEQVAKLVLELRQDIRDRFGHDPHGADFWCWLSTFGVQEFELIRDLMPPIPPHEVFRFVGSETELGFLETGAHAYTMISELLEAQGLRVEDRKLIFDFGSGPGRVLRYFMRQWETTGLVGADVDETAIKWAQEHFPFGEFVRNDPEPPLPFDAGVFDLIYGISVFSHLNEANHLVWLEELHRVSSPDAVLIFTVMGEHALGRLENETEFREWAGLRPQDLEFARTGLSKGGFAFV
ncbi:MAG: class I SAM-dependent methyltransferase, partial [Salinibacterium sp.]|nr:class I SAM-dependent methyltransferase [Salinibacterium sp.]